MLQHLYSTIYFEVFIMNNNYVINHVSKTRNLTRYEVLTLLKNNHIDSLEKFVTELYSGSLNQSVAQVVYYKVQSALFFNNIDKKALSNSSITECYFKDKLFNLEQEELHAVFLNSQLQIISEKMIFKGTVNRAVTAPRDILREAVKCNATSYIIAHNHPSGNLTPSKEDIAFTKNLFLLNNVIGISCLDHIICCNDNASSLKSLDLI